MLKTLIRRLLITSLRPDCFPAVNLLFWVVLIGMSWFMFRTMTEANHLLHIRNAKDDLQKALLSEESGQRGYLLSGNRLHWERFDIGRQRVPIFESEIETLITVNSPNYKALDRARDLIRLKEAEMQLTIVLSDANRKEEALALFNTNKGETYMRDINAELNKIDHEATSRFWSCFAWLSTSLLPLFGLRSSFLSGR